MGASDVITILPDRPAEEYEYLTITLWVGVGLWFSTCFTPM